MQVTSKEWRLTGDCCHLYQAAKDAASLSRARSPRGGWYPAALPVDPGQENEKLI